MKQALPFLICAITLLIASCKKEEMNAGNNHSTNIDTADIKFGTYEGLMLYNRYEYNDVPPYNYANDTNTYPATITVSYVEYDSIRFSYVPFRGSVATFLINSTDSIYISNYTWCHPFYPDQCYPYPPCIYTLKPSVDSLYLSCSLIGINGGESYTFKGKKVQ